jgi:hypothetical protein
MKCSDVRFALAADPSNAGAEVAAHLDSCASCAAYAQDMVTLDGKLRQALHVPAPEIALPSGPHPVASVPRRWRALRQLALAASIAGVALLVGVLWIGVPRQSLASAVVEHMAHEPDAWASRDVLAAAAVAPVLARSGVALREDMPAVSYANSCWFRGRYVPHLVVRTPAGPVTIMVLPKEEVAGRVAFDEGGYRGVIVAAQRGAIAVLAQDPSDVDADAVASMAMAALSYLD